MIIFSSTRLESLWWSSQQSDWSIQSLESDSFLYWTPTEETSTLLLILIHVLVKYPTNVCKSCLQCCKLFYRYLTPCLQPIMLVILTEDLQTLKLYKFKTNINAAVFNQYYVKWCRAQVFKICFSDFKCFMKTEIGSVLLYNVKQPWIFTRKKRTCFNQHNL